MGVYKRVKCTCNYSTQYIQELPKFVLENKESANTKSLFSKYGVPKQVQYFLAFYGYRKNRVGYRTQFLHII